MPIMTDERYLNVEDIAKLLGRSENTVKRLFREGDLPGVKIGGHWYITPTDWQKYIEEKRNKNKK